jgi:hypothetical protein
MAIRGEALTELVGTRPIAGKTPRGLVTRPGLHQCSQPLRPSPPHMFDGVAASASVSGRHC